MDFLYVNIRFYLNFKNLILRRLESLILFVDPLIGIKIVMYRLEDLQRRPLSAIKLQLNQNKINEKDRQFVGIIFYLQFQFPDLD